MSLTTTSPDRRIPDYGWFECEMCGQYQTPHSGKCDHCGAKNKHLIHRFDRDDDSRMSAFWSRKTGLPRKTSEL